MSENVVAVFMLILVFLSGAIITLIIFADSIKLGTLATTMIQECEISLPRDQICEISMSATPREVTK